MCFRSIDVYKRQPEIPLENIKAFYRAINDYNNQEISNDFSGNGCP